MQVLLFWTDLAKVSIILVMFVFLERSWCDDPEMAAMVSVIDHRRWDCMVFFRQGDVYDQ